MNLANLPLPHDHALIAELCQQFGGRQIQFRLIESGSRKMKIIAEPDGVVPYFIKTGPVDQLSAEHAGDRVLRECVPPVNIAPFAGYVERSDRAAIMYQYLGPGDARDSHERLDGYLLKNADGLRDRQVVTDLFDRALHPCHWTNGRVQMLCAEFPPLKLRDTAVDPTIWTEVSARYKALRKRASRIPVPHGTVHGDLDTKNVLVTQQGEPVLIDFAKAAACQPVMLDYAIFEVNLQFDLDPAYVAPFFPIAEQVYSHQPLILPRHDAHVAGVIQTVRSTLWKHCMGPEVNMTPDDIDTVYRMYLVSFLARLYWMHPGGDRAKRDIASREIRAMTSEIPC